MINGLLRTFFAVGDAIVGALEPSKPKKRAPDSPMTIAKRERTMRRKKEIRAALKEYRLGQADLLAQYFKKNKKELGVVAMSGKKDELTVSFREMKDVAETLEQAIYLLGCEERSQAKRNWRHTLEFNPMAQTVTAVSRSANESYEIWPCLNSNHRYDEASDEFLKALKRANESEK
ncbi:MAG: hypothetical protein ACQEUK_06390 [Pseudomonadota bacterium]